MIVLAALPLFVLILLVGILNHQFGSLRAAILAAATVWGVALTAITELLSLWGCLTQRGVLVCWALLAIVFGVWRLRSRGGRIALGSVAAQVRSATFGRAVLFAIGFYLAATLVVALLAPPNTWDSMTYHMSRVMHWIQDRSVSHYPTHVPRQIELSPGAEYVILHLQLLSGSDRLANLPQWFAMLGSLIGASLIAKRLGAGPLGEGLAVVTCLTIPMGVLQSTSTQNDYVLSFWLVCATWTLLELSRSGRMAEVLAWSMLFGAAMGLSFLTKSTTFLFAPAMLVWFVVALLKRLAARFWMPAVLAGVVAACINAGALVRNYQTFSTPLGDRSLVELVSNTTWTPRPILGNIMRNLAVHANLPVPGAIELATDLVRSLHRTIGADPDDPKTTYPGVQFRVHGPFHFEDVAGGGVHLLLIAVALGACTGMPRNKRWNLLAYAAMWIAGFALLCLYLRWQPWNARLHLPLFVLMSPLVGTTLSARLTRPAWCVLAAVLLFLGLPYVVFNQSRAIVGRRNIFSLSRRELLFFNRPHLMEPYEMAARKLAESGCRRIGLIMGIDDWEYPLWFLTQESELKGCVLQHIHVANASSTLERRAPFNGFDPCRVAVWDATGRPRLETGD